MHASKLCYKKVGDNNYTVSKVDTAMFPLWAFKGNMCTSLSDKHAVNFVMFSIRFKGNVSVYKG